MQEKRTVLVTGATGGQGGAVARALLDRGWGVRALVRSPEAPAARALAALGAEPVVGDLDDPGSLRAAARGAHGVFSVQPCDLADPDPATEVRRGRNVADAAAAAGAAHLVYTSAAAAGQGSGVAHFESKAEIEAYVESAGVPATVLRPVYFMENWRYALPRPGHGGGESVGAGERVVVGEQGEQVATGKRVGAGSAAGERVETGERVVPAALDAETPLQLIALADIGRIAAAVFGAPAEFAGRRIDIAGDELPVRRIAELFAAADGVPTRFERLPDAELRERSPEVAKMYAWINGKGFRADLAALRARHPGLLTLEAWLRTR
ncbi:NmrA family NAD(P)-binding protein [Nocardiopsis changdeensis]|uniref:NmrA family NAD(P)-binding protein n=1 Tax=Nocardiopsis changdeensis TaxID=2831969 RepID=A0ABX8BNH9_9ACTN|nr:MULTISPECIES: NmrA family NAD(P)-binding protein [Nocardiopsis]QUX22431.1 NmrA family NAD(P)-binding protein [Nocardiopsis changdeensis]QYX38373.1 NmrA family NAD(P)-binding protein [Nocardiopsis sp. MT53]